MRVTHLRGYTAIAVFWSYALTCAQECVRLLLARACYRVSRGRSFAWLVLKDEMRDIVRLCDSDMPD